MTVTQYYERILVALVARKALIDEAIRIIKLLEASDVFDEAKIRKLTKELQEAVAQENPVMRKRGRPPKQASASEQQK